MIRWLLAWCLLSGVPVTARAAPQVETVAPTVDAIDNAAAACRRQHRATADCRSLAAMKRALDIQLDAERTTVGVAQPLPADRDRIAERRWRRLLADTRAGRAALCRAATDVAARFPEPDGGGDGFVAGTLVELAFRLDRSDGTSCLPPLLLRLRRLGPVDDLIATEHRFCVETWRFGRACDAIARR